jgi:vacuolar protein sorting-associated protein 26
MSYFFSTPVDIDIVLEDADDRQMVDVKLDKNRREKAPLYMDGESVRGAVTVRPKDGKRLEHTGIKVQFIGTIGKPPPWLLLSPPLPPPPSTILSQARNPRLAPTLLLPPDRMGFQFFAENGRPTQRCSLTAATTTSSSR